MAEVLEYLRDGAEIYARSFAIIRAEADLSRFSAEARGPLSFSAWSGR